MSLFCTFKNVFTVALCFFFSQSNQMLTPRWRQLHEILFFLIGIFIDIFREKLLKNIVYLKKSEPAWMMKLKLPGYFGIMIFTHI